MSENSAPSEQPLATPAATDQPVVDPAGDWFTEGAAVDVPVRGDIRSGTIASVSRAEILVDIGAKSEGMINSREIENMSREARRKLAEGDEVTVYVVNPEDRNGNIILSLAKAEEEMDWRSAEELRKTQDVLEGSIGGFNKGGVLVQMGRVRGFVPASQLDSARREIRHGSSPEERWAHLVGEPIQVKVIEVDRSRNRLILSERAAVKEWRDSQKERLLDELQEGEIREGRVINLADFGAFVDLGGADGLIHLSELSWKRVAHPREVIDVGADVKVYILNVDRERKRIGLSLKRLQPDPWLAVEQNYQVGTLAEAVVTKLTKFGAFARLSGLDEIEGLVHISELSEEHVEHPREVLEEGQTITVRVIRVDAQRRRLGLSIKRVDSDEYVDADWFDGVGYDAVEVDDAEVDDAEVDSVEVGAIDLDEAEISVVGLDDLEVDEESLAQDDSEE